MTCVQVDSIIEELGLTACKDTLIGDDSVRGISGGMCIKLLNVFMSN